MSPYRETHPPQPDSLHPALRHASESRLRVRLALAAWEDPCPTCDLREPDAVCGGFHVCDSPACGSTLQGAVLSVTVEYHDGPTRYDENGGFCDAACFTRASRAYHEEGWQDYEVAGNALAILAVLDLVTNEPKSDVVQVKPQEEW